MAVAQYFSPDPFKDQPIEKQLFKNKLHQVLSEYAKTTEDELLDMAKFLEWLKRS